MTTPPCTLDPVPVAPPTLSLPGRALFLTALVVFFAALPAGGRADATDGAELAWKYHCMTCHGRNGVASSSRYPNLAGQNEAYLVSRLRYFRSGVEHRNQMNAQAAPLSDEEIDALARHYSRMSG